MSELRPRHVLNIAIKKADGPVEDFLGFLIVLLIVAGIHYRQESSSMNRLKTICIAYRNGGTIIDVPPHFHFAVARLKLPGRQEERQYFVHPGSSSSRAGSPDDNSSIRI